MDVFNYFLSTVIIETVRAALVRGGAERLEEEAQFVLKALPGLAAEDGVLDKLLARLGSGESPYTIIGRYPLPHIQRWVAVPAGVMPPGCDTADTIAVIRYGPVTKSV